VTLEDTISGSTIQAGIIDGVLIIADHPLPVEYADELVVVDATDSEIAALEAAGYRWRRSE
jgi:hypothetical protein